MTKITERNESSSLLAVDKALIEQAIDAINSECGYSGSNSYEPRAITEALRAALKEGNEVGFAKAEPAVEPVGYASIEGLRQLQSCNGMSVWCESPSMWGPKEQAPPAPENLVAIYTAPRPMHFEEPVAWVHDRFIENDDGMRIGTDEPELQWGKYVPDDDGGWFPLYASPQPPAEVPLLTDAKVRSIYLANGFTVKEGQPDLKPYVFEAARALEQAVLQKAGLV